MCCKRYTGIDCILSKFMTCSKTKTHHIIKFEKMQQLFDIMRCQHRDDGRKCKNGIIDMNCTIYAYCVKHNHLYTEISKIIQ